MGDASFFAGLGQFVLAYSHAERALKFLACQAAGIKDEQQGLAVFGSARVGPLIDTVRRLFEARNANIPADADAMLSQFKAIHSMRDKLLHQGFVWATGHGYVTTNVKDVHHPSRSKTYPVSEADLTDMRADLERIHHDAILYALREFLSGSESRISASLLATGQAKPWRYTPPQPVPLPGKDSSRSPK
jgi:hypothetical protein